MSVTKSMMYLKMDMRLITLKLTIQIRGMADLVNMITQL